jgi:hypothetical protein
VADIETEAGTAVGSPGVLTQVAALPILRSSSGTFEVLLITTRDNGRWIIPTGWPMKGRKDHKPPLAKRGRKPGSSDASVSGHLGVIFTENAAAIVSIYARSLRPSTGIPSSRVSRVRTSSARSWAPNWRAA